MGWEIKIDSIDLHATFQMYNLYSTLFYLFLYSINIVYNYIYRII
jgi:hypothetical protein